ncbi:hypothetical protein BO70DRAFT_369922 [Aspergillus heteromorphus CBS 117.55]|uniref:Indole-diterpene biosynthesis protein PaxU n=1 Tax=Aspergillus heteromorphus CBS 117.55 TaxID=1448321 RepID=A0A317WPQ9_9EURO|nr:uncharacterized protein BO70DRAFT_369922 [Aspergillus heteromorphus CBS 117.55]PWY86878.1 hypothetical protein BO70DRAFT_369922 [Aspergillus heteromorphus CBS 117.55]
MVSPSPTQLTPTIHIQEALHPPTATTPEFPNQPQTVILAFWMNAPPRAYTKYITQYQTLLPHARILILLNTSSSFLLPPNPATEQQTRLSPAVSVLRSASSSSSTVHIHLFSNGGVFSTTNLLAAYRNATGQPLPVSSILIDSAPGKPTIAGGFRAFSYMLPSNVVLRTLGQVVLGMGLVVMFLGFWACGVRDAVSVGREALNDPALFGGLTAGRVRRCYVYSKEDDLVEWTDVEEHAEEAEKLGAGEVRREKFHGSKHVCHMRVDSERYWGIVRSLWYRDS